MHAVPALHCSEDEEEDGGSEEDEEEGGARAAAAGSGSDADAASDDEGDEEEERPQHDDPASDSSEDERPARNTVGNVPLEWYQAEEHIGYDLAGRKLEKRGRRDRLDKHIAKGDALAKVRGRRAGAGADAGGAAASRGGCSRAPARVVAFASPTYTSCPPSALSTTATITPHHTGAAHRVRRVQ